MPTMQTAQLHIVLSHLASSDDGQMTLFEQQFTALCVNQAQLDASNAMYMCLCRARCVGCRYVVSLSH